MRAIAFSLLAFSWASLWLTADQQGQRLFDEGRFDEAAKTFEDPRWKATSLYRSGEFEEAEKAFAQDASADSEYNRGNCLVFLGRYDEAVERYDRALELRPNFPAAEDNRKLAQLRAKQVERKGGDMGDQKLGADEIRFDKNQSPEGQETKIDNEPINDSAMQSLWLRKIQTEPADFLRAKFAYQLDNSPAPRPAKP